MLWWATTAHIQWGIRCCYKSWWCVDIFSINRKMANLRLRAYLRVVILSVRFMKKFKMQGVSAPRGCDKHADRETAIMRTFARIGGATAGENNVGKEDNALVDRWTRASERRRVSGGEMAAMEKRLAWGSTRTLELDGEIEKERSIKAMTYWSPDVVREVSLKPR